MTGRLEVTIFPNAKDAKGKGTKVHSKAKGEGYPYKDWDAFFKKIDEVLATVKWRLTY